MEEIISFFTNIYTQDPELVLVVSSGACMVLIAWIITFLSERFQEREQGRVISEGVSQIETIPSEFLPHVEEEVTVGEESEVEEVAEEELVQEEVIEDIEAEEAITEELIEEEVISEVEPEEIEVKEPEVPQEEIRAEVEEAELREIEVEEEPEETKEGLFSRLRSGLSKTQAGLLGRLEEMLSVRTEIDSSLWDEFEEALVLADVGAGTTMKLRDQIESKLTNKARQNPMLIKDALKEEILKVLKDAEGNPPSLNVKPFVIVVAGVNGVGKTTSIGKLAYKYRKDGKNVMVAAADTFRAAAVEQLEVWSNRVGSDFLKGQSGADPSAVAFDAVKAAVNRETDVLIIDTAGRLHTKTNLMEELKKIRRVIERALPGAPHETLLVLDATTGQNAIQQAKMFNEAIEVTGIVLTKLDGTAKGGVIVGIADQLNIPVKFIGIGERLGDLREFNAEEFVEALFVTGKETLH